MDFGKILAAEKSSERLQELPEFFYQNAKKQIDAATQQFQEIASSDNLEADLLASAIAADRRARSGIITRRITKILKSATLDGLKHDARANPVNAQGPEKDLYLSIFQSVKSASEELSS